jgi:AraC-like DNA-binding protein
LKLFNKNITGSPAKAEKIVAGENQDLVQAAVERGGMVSAEKISIKIQGELENTWLKSDFELLKRKDWILIYKIRSVVIDMIYFSDELPLVKYSDYISKQLGINYSYLSKLFSKAVSVTIEHFIIAHKIERVKDLLSSSELTVSEIAWKLHYSSTAHLSAQFKKVTGLTPSLFKKSYNNMVSSEN